MSGNKGNQQQTGAGNNAGEKGKGQSGSPGELKKDSNQEVDPKEKQLTDGLDQLAKDREAFEKEKSDFATEKENSIQQLQSDRSTFESEKENFQQVKDAFVQEKEKFHELITPQQAAAPGTEKIQGKDVKSFGSDEAPSSGDHSKKK